MPSTVAAWLKPGFSAVEIIDSGADLNAYAKAENAAGCCTAVSTSLPIAELSACCTPKVPEEALHARLAKLLRKYNVNDFAASVRIFAVKPAE